MTSNFEKRSAFTLIEFLIALVIIGFIVAILVGVFSSPLKQARLDSAVSQSIDTFRQLEDSVNRLQAKTGCVNGLVGPSSCYVQVTTGGGLAGHGILVAQPALPGAIFTNGTANDSEPAGLGRGLYYGDTALDAIWGRAGKFYISAIDVVTFAGVSEEACKRFNEMMGYGAVIINPPPGDMVDKSKAGQCVFDANGGFTGTANTYSFVWPIF